MLGFLAAVPVPSGLQHGRHDLFPAVVPCTVALGAEGDEVGGVIGIAGAAPCGATNEVMSLQPTADPAAVLARVVVSGAHAGRDVPLPVRLAPVGTRSLRNAFQGAKPSAGAFSTKLVAALFAGPQRKSAVVTTNGGGLQRFGLNGRAALPAGKNARLSGKPEGVHSRRSARALAAEFLSRTRRLKEVTADLASLHGQSPHGSNDSTVRPFPLLLAVEP